MWEAVGDLVAVPDVVGMPFHLGRARAAECGVTLASLDPDGPPIGALAWPGLFYIVTQHPEAGAVVTRHASVRVEIVAHGDMGDTARVRSPRPPSTDAAHAAAPPRPRESGGADSDLTAH
ncbi:PASTA domain-containing protein [Microbacterium sp. CJ88]|uniref:PASTA domain-containing protein n=1 Tax=Microbacterium sp. CJ88 TaxID=3445672 RepID=UPI003F657519